MAIAARVFLIGDIAFVERGILVFSLGLRGALPSSCEDIIGGGVVVFSGRSDSEIFAADDTSTCSIVSSLKDNFGIKELIDVRGIDEFPRRGRVGDWFLSWAKDGRGRRNDGVGISLIPVFDISLLNDFLFFSDG